MTAKPDKVSSIDHAYTEGDDRTLNPELLDMTLVDRMPSPTGWRMLVLPYAGQRKTKAGILLTKETMDREALATVVAYVVKKVRFAITIKKSLAISLGVRKSNGCLLVDIQAHDSN